MEIRAAEREDIRVREAPEPTPLEDTRAPLRELYADDQFQVLTDTDVSPSTAKALTEKLHAAYRFDLAQNRWSETSALLEPVSVQLLSDQGFFKLTHARADTTAGWTLNANVVLMPARFVHALSAETLDTIAHELNHLQDYRILGARRHEIPVYLQEGKAYVLGDMFGNASYLHGIAGQVSALSARQARSSLDRFITDRDEYKRTALKGELVGAAFVEYLRVHVRPDAIASIAAVMTEVGRGVAFGIAFAKQLGLPLAKAKADFVDFMAATEHHPSARLSGTVWSRFER